MKLKPIHRTLLGITLFLLLGVAGVADAANGKNTNGKGPKGGDDNKTSVTITFADSLGDGVLSDNGTSYVDGIDEVEAFIGSSANYGNLFLRLDSSARGLVFDFSACTPGSSSPCYYTGLYPDSLVRMKVEANGELTDGMLGMLVGEEITAPMRIYYDYDPGRDPSPGFIHFEPNLKGKSPCRNGSLQVLVTRDAAEQWTVRSPEPALACATLPSGDGGGQYLMPFSLTVTAP